MTTTKTPTPAPQRPETRRKLYEEQYKASKEGGEQFFPDSLYRDTAVALVVVALIFILAVFLPASSELPADPTGRAYNPRPEWYFLFMFQFLKYFPGYLEPVAAVALPGLAILVILAVPFLDVGLNRTWSHRKPQIAIGALAVAGIVALSIAGALSAPIAPAAEDPLVVEGQRIYRERNCSYCHSMNGIGGAVGPDLSAIGGRADRQLLTAYLQNPAAMIPQTLHPKLQFTSDEMNALVAYLLTLGGKVPHTAEAPALVEQHCLACHIVNGQGGRAGPDLTNVGNQRSVAYLESFITDPKSEAPAATMPGFRGVLTQAQISDVAAYLYNQRQAPASPSPTAPSPATPAPAPSPTPAAALTGAGLYARDCAVCHGSNRANGTAPPLTPSSLAGESDSELASTIRKGEDGMPPFPNLTSEQVDSLVRFIKYTP